MKIPNERGRLLTCMYVRSTRLLPDPWSKFWLGLRREMASGCFRASVVWSHPHRITGMRGDMLGKGPGAPTPLWAHAGLRETRLFLQRALFFLPLCLCLCLSSTPVKFSLILQTCVLSQKSSPSKPSLKIHLIFWYTSHNAYRFKYF